MQINREDALLPLGILSIFSSTPTIDIEPIKQTGIPFANLSDSRPVIQNFLMSICLELRLFFFHFKL